MARFKQEMARRFTAAQIEALLAELRGFSKVPNPDRLMQLLAGDK